MSEIERIRRYIDRCTPNKTKGYDIRAKELLALANGMPCIDAVLYAFAYGKAKGYRAAKADAKHG